MQNTMKKENDLETKTNEAGEKLEEQKKYHELFKQNIADPVKYLTGEAMKAVQETFVPDPKDPTYQFSRKIAKPLLKKPENEFEETIQEGFIIVVYNFLDNFLRKLYKK